MARAILPVFGYLQVVLAPVQLCIANEGDAIETIVITLRKATGPNDIDAKLGSLAQTLPSVGVPKGFALYVPFGWVPLIVGVESYPDEKSTYPEPDHTLTDKTGFITFYVPAKPSDREQEQVIAVAASQVSATIHSKPNALKPYIQDIKVLFVPSGIPPPSPKRLMMVTKFTSAVDPRH